MKKKQALKSIGIIALGILVSFIVGTIFLQIQGYNAIASYISMFENSLFTSIGLTNTFARTAVLLMIGLAGFIGFNSGVSNLGLYGQALTGALVATLIGIYVDLPTVVLVPLIILVAGGAGALVAGVAAFFKDKFNMDELITTLMLNFIIEFTISFLVANPLNDAAAAWPMSPQISENGVLGRIGIFDVSVILSIAFFIALYIFWSKTVKGYELRITGANNLFARLGGSETKKNLYTTMMLSGFLAGIAGAFLIIGSTQQNKLFPRLGNTNADNGLMVAIISGASMPSVVFFSFFFSILQTGAVGMQLDTSVPMEFTIMLQAIMVLLVVAFRDYSDIIRVKFSTWKQTKEIRGEK